MVVIWIVALVGDVSEILGGKECSRHGCGCLRLMAVVVDVVDCVEGPLEVYESLMV